MNSDKSKDSVESHSSDEPCCNFGSVIALVRQILLCPSRYFILAISPAIEIRGEVESHEQCEEESWYTKGNPEHFAKLSFVLRMVLLGDRSTSSMFGQSWCARSLMIDVSLDLPPEIFLVIRSIEVYINWID